MPYRISEEVITPYLNTIKAIYDNATKNSVTILETKFPRETRWNLLQALNACRELNKEPYNQLSVIIKKRASDKGDIFLVVYPRIKPSEIDIKIHAANLERAVPIYGASSLMSVVTETIKAKEPLISFPDLDPSLTSAVTTWAEKMGHAITNTSPLTIRKGNGTGTS